MVPCNNKQPTWNVHLSAWNVSTQRYFGKFMKLGHVFSVREFFFPGKYSYLNKKLKGFSKPNLVYRETYSDKCLYLQFMIKAHKGCHGI